MKITSVDVIKLKRLAFSTQTPVLCRINTDEGIYGYGEAGVSIQDFSVGSYEILKLMSKPILGMDPLEIDVIYSKLTSMFWSQGNGGVIMAAISAIDTALWDIKAKYFGVPLYKLLGGKHRDKLRTYASQLQNGWKYHDFINAPGDLDFLRKACQDALADGYTAVKIDFTGKGLDGKRLSGDMQRNWLTPDVLNLFVERVRVARETLGPDVDIIMENHCNTSANTAIQFARAAEKYNIMFLEEPCNPLSPIEHKKISENTTIPVATGERTYTRWGYLPILMNGSVSVIQPDLGNCGGVTEAGRSVILLRYLVFRYRPTPAILRSVSLFLSIWRLQFQTSSFMSTIQSILCLRYGNCVFMTTSLKTAISAFLKSPASAMNSLKRHCPKQ